MPVEKHDLEHERPQSKATIQKLRADDLHFSQLYDDYHQVETDIHRYETGAENTSDEHLEELKKQRLHLKDSLFRILDEHEENGANA